MTKLAFQCCACWLSVVSLGNANLATESCADSNSQTLHNGFTASVLQTKLHATQTHSETFPQTEKKFEVIASELPELNGIYTYVVQSTWPEATAWAKDDGSGPIILREPENNRWIVFNDQAGVTGYEPYFATSRGEESGFNGPWLRGLNGKGTLQVKEVCDAFAGTYCRNGGNGDCSSSNIRIISQDGCQGTLGSSDVTMSEDKIKNGDVTGTLSGDTITWSNGAKYIKQALCTFFTTSVSCPNVRCLWTDSACSACGFFAGSYCRNDDCSNAGIRVITQIGCEGLIGSDYVTMSLNTITKGTATGTLSGDTISWSNGATYTLQTLSPTQSPPPTEASTDGKETLSSSLEKVGTDTSSPKADGDSEEILEPVAGPTLPPTARPTKAPAFVTGAKVAIKGMKHNKYCADEGSAVGCNRDVIGDWEKFEVKTYGVDKVALKGGRDNKWCGEGHSWLPGRGMTVKCDRDTVQGWEKFSYKDYGPSASGHIVSLKGGKDDRYCSDEGSTWECDGRSGRVLYEVECVSGCR